MWPLPSSLTWWEQAVLFMFAIQACQTSLFPNWLGSYQFISFQNKSRLIWATEGKMFSRSGNSFAWHFQSWIVLLQIYILLLSFTIWVQRSESILKVFFPPQAARQHLSSDVYLGSAEHPSFLIHVSPKMTLFSREWQSLILIVIECALQAMLVRCLFLLPRLCVVDEIDVCCVCLQINTKKLKPEQEPHYCVFFLLCPCRWSHQQSLRIP